MSKLFRDAIRARAEELGKDVIWWDEQEIRKMSVPTQGEVFAKMMEHIRYAQEGAAAYAHLCRANGDGVRADGFLRASESFKRMTQLLTELATKHIN